MWIHCLTWIIYTMAVVLMACGVRMLSKSAVRLPEHLQRRNIVKTGGMLSRTVRESSMGSMSRRAEERKTDGEIYESIVLLRNIITLNEGNELGAENVISILAAQSRLLQPAYGKMLTLMRVGKTKEAYEVFERETRTDMGRELGSLLVHWDEIIPEELLEILETQQQNLRQRRITAQKKKDEIVSEVIYFPVIVNVFIIFVNFVYVGFFYQQQELLKTIF